MENLDEILMEISKTVKPPYTYNQETFVPGVSPVYYAGPLWDHNEIYGAMKTFLTGAWLPSGEQVQKFQEKFATMFNVEHAHMVNSGSSANLVLITALKKFYKWEDGAEIIVSPVGFPTTIAPIAQNNLTPVFVDIELNTLNFDVTKIAEKITDKTVAIFVSPVLGNPPDMDYLQQLAFDHDIMLIGDNCDSLGSRWNGEFLTEYYTAWTTSFYPAHHITTGEGGMICSNDADFMNTVRSIAWWGRDCYCVGANNLLPCGTCGKRFDKWLDGYEGVIDHKYLFTNMGYNLKPLDMQGSIGLAQLDKMEIVDKSRRENKIKFQSILTNHVNGIRVASHHDLADPSWFGVPIICRSQIQKERLQKHLEANKIQTRNYFAGNILMHPGYKHLDDYTKYPNANRALSHVFFVGCPPHYNDAVFSYIESVLEKWDN
jgi:CDP-6-deoxy-D-xylo-4-hexulose-3-dehydrase